MIHTGTNDLHSLQKDSAEAVRKIAEQASQEFPETCIVVYTLLPRTDTPPHVIHDINIEIRKGCVLECVLNRAREGGAFWRVGQGKYFRHKKLPISFSRGCYNLGQSVFAYNSHTVCHTFENLVSPD